jgi:hypothetical protein
MGMGTLEEVITISSKFSMAITVCAETLATASKEMGINLFIVYPQ